jgi:hypothetical protein
MGNAKHIDGVWALIAALGVGIAVANAPAVALAAPGDSGTSSSSGGSSPSSSSRDSGSASSDTRSPRRASSTANDPPSRHRGPQNAPGSSSGGQHTSRTTGSSASVATTAALTPSTSTSTSSTGPASTPATPETPGTHRRQSGGAISRPGPGFTSAKTSPTPATVNAQAFDSTARESRLDGPRFVAVRVPSFASTMHPAAATPVALSATPVSSTAAAAPVVPSRPASVVVTPTADPVSRLVSTLINAVLSPFANRAPSAPAQEPGAWTLLAFARREFGQTSSSRSTTDKPLAGQITNGLATDTVGSTSADTSPAVDPGFISNTHNFGLFSITTAADPNDNFVAFVLSTPIFTNILTSGADPEDNLGFGAASIGIAGHTVNTFMSPFFNFTVDIPIEDPFAELFTALVRLGL